MCAMQLHIKRKTPSIADFLRKLLIESEIAIPNCAKSCYAPALVSGSIRTLTFAVLAIQITS